MQATPGAAAKRRAYQAVNTELVSLYWELGAYISKKISTAEWGDGVVEELADTLAREYPGARGYTRPNLFRMRQFYEAYCDDAKVSPLVRQLSWTHHLIVLGQVKQLEERELYILAAIRGQWSKRELERQIRTQAARRHTPSLKKASPMLAQVHPDAIEDFKNVYSFEFLDLPEGHSERIFMGRSSRAWATSSRSSAATSASSVPNTWCRSASRISPSTWSSFTAASCAWLRSS